MSILKGNLIDLIKVLTNKLRLDLIGPHKLPQDAFRYISFSYRKFDPSTTIKAAYLDGNLMNNGMKEAIDQQTIETLEDTALETINNFEQKAITDHTRILSNFEHDKKKLNKIVDPESRNKAMRSLIKETKKALKDQRKKLKSTVQTIVEHELNNGQAFGAHDGIIAATTSIGIKDPTVFKIVVNDDDLCKYCEKLHLLDDKKTPKVYKLSELSATPGNDWKNPKVSIGPVHPNCRCQLTTLMPGFGFDTAGRVTYIGKDHDELKNQRN